MIVYVILAKNKKELNKFRELCKVEGYKDYFWLKGKDRYFLFINARNMNNSNKIVEALKDKISNTPKKVYIYHHGSDTENLAGKVKSRVEEDYKNTSAEINKYSLGGFADENTHMKSFEEVNDETFREFYKFIKEICKNEGVEIESNKTTTEGGNFTEKNQGKASREEIRMNLINEIVQDITEEIKSIKELTEAEKGALVILKEKLECLISIIEEIEEKID